MAFHLPTINPMQMEHPASKFATHLPTFVHVGFFFCLSILLLQPSNCLRNMGNETDKLALLQFKDRIENDPDGILSSWNNSVNFCWWKGVACGLKHQRVVSLNMQGMRLSGTISPYIGNLTFLRSLNLVDNSFHGEIPPEIGRLFRLRNLNLTKNTLAGEIPVNISCSSELRVLDLTKNNLKGKIPGELGHLNKLVALGLSQNNLTGEIPHSLGNLSSLSIIGLGFNNLEGKIPDELGQLANLAFFVINFNKLIGTIPSTLYNISSIRGFFVSSNQLSGGLPENIALLHNLQTLTMGENQFHGSIPASWNNISQLQQLDISRNILTGEAPNNLGGMYNLQRLNLERNFLGNYSSEDLRFVASLSNCSNLKVLFFDKNNFGGVLPNSIANLSALELLGLGRNRISGRIPWEVGNLVNLILLGMDQNLLSGSIPVSFGKLGKLQLLSLELNMLSGEIPSSLGNITQLSALYLDGNRLKGNITLSIGNCQFLNILEISQNQLTGKIPQQIFGLVSLSKLVNLSSNSFTGSLPVEVGKLKNLPALDVSENMLSGGIPEAIGECFSLGILNLQGNHFQGPIPSSFVSLRGLQHVDLSRNNLSGKIPKYLGNLLFLQYLNLSFNYFVGEVPKNGIFRNVSAFSLDGNSNLCGGIPELQLPACPTQNQKQKKNLKPVILTATIVPIVFILIITSFLIFHRRKPRMNVSSMPFIGDRFLQVSYKELLEATGGFSVDNLIGQGSFGSVYKGSLPQTGNKLVAVKVLNLQQHGASKSFTAECKALSIIRHRNLVKILTCCSSIDFKGNEFRALVYDFMSNGSLEICLYPAEANGGGGQKKALNLLQRLQIAIDVAAALHYLHGHCEMPIIHCDLKPSNILLDSDMTAHIGDFGLSRLLLLSKGQTSSIGLKGTIGYMAPEYGIGNEATTAGDVYSFGVILLEMFTGKKPTDEGLSTLNLHKFVKANLQRRVIMKILDPTLVVTREVLEKLAAVEERTEGSDRCYSKTEIQEDDVSSIENFGSKRDNLQKCIVSVFEIGLACSSELPEDRMSMKDVTRKLNLIKERMLLFVPEPQMNYHV